jgi:hypothetical protein
MDTVIPCNGAAQYSPWTPWVNDTGVAQYLTGVIAYAGDSHGNMGVQVACLQILATNGTQRFITCNGLNVRGEVAISPQRIAPGEQIVAQASNACGGGAVWDWAGFLLLAH